ncbi:MAG: hypothetical protein CEN89_263 [Candidatus Berkelbacteria bacterium Licking1014_7]|uniref:Tryptophan--tRNA ligase n=1 Tax=Candidatus Berkelbacteria bacterium Licking1014_7 TaxID=2017147 RepID=A0A554LJR2_9BACT|nr:MAG: hypothetical protein CEN89_263 [Candidatus Berkelbacteria bacterium Licking1014_7]
MTNQKQRVFSGIRPTGEIHLGNFLGSVNQWSELQNNYDCVFAVVDYHAITTTFESKELPKAIIETSKWIIASGVDQQKSLIILQSQIPEHTELAWILNCLTPLGELERMTQFKEKREQETAKSGIMAGLLNYPVLMASDILLYQTDLVPVGEDQVQHIELARDIAKRFNNRFGKVFTIPNYQLSKNARVMSLKNPTEKMSKTGDQGILLSDSAKEIERKIMGATTDTIASDQMSAGVKNLCNILQTVSPRTYSQMLEKYQKKTLQYLELKKVLAKELISYLLPIQKKYHQISDDQALEIFEKSRARAQSLAQKTLSRAKKTIGVL